jgi:1-acyl-sn-glycerol-3-phosphate acyltransferase
MGGAPIDRTGNLNKVDSIVEIFENHSEFRLAIAPEGTRKKVTELKTGFYYIALKVNIPIISVAFDFGNKVVRIGKPLLPSGNFDMDLPILLENFKYVVGKIPQYSFTLEK